MLESVNAIKQILKCVTSAKCQQHFRVFCLRNNIFRIRTARKKRKLRDVLLFCSGLLTKPIIQDARCKDQLQLSKLICQTPQTQVKTVKEEDPWMATSSRIEAVSPNNGYFSIRIIMYLYRTTVRAIKIMLRIVSLSLFFTPFLITFPFAYFWSGFEELWWRWMLWMLQRSGPTFIKLGQWASTRRDIFTKNFCDRMSVLHTKTTCRPWHRSQHALNDLFGDSRWKDFLLSIEADPVGSGCIAEVYKGILDVYAFEKITGIHLPFAKNRYVDVAIKTAKDGVRESIDIDLSIMQCAVRLMEIIMPRLSYINPVSCLSQFKEVLELQVDLRNEARALKRFGNNFDPIKTRIRFPEVICYSKDVIIETFEDGLYINRLVTDEQLVEHSKLKKKIALIGVRALLKMIFVDNFVHGDLHPGNILLRFIPTYLLRTKWKNLVFKGIIKSYITMSGGTRISYDDYGLDESGEPTLVILDTGIALEETTQNLQKLRLLFRAVIDKRGRDVGALLLLHSPNQHCKNPDQFCDEVDQVVQIARSKNNLRKLNISEMLNELFLIVSRHQVALDPSFTTVVLAVIVLEGLGRSLDPDLDLFHCARPKVMSAHSAYASSLTNFMRVVERDDVLLYVTAAVGIFMPGCVYMFYQYAHKLYTGYVEKRELRKREEQLERQAVTIFYAEGKGNVEELAHHIGAHLEYEGLPIVNLADIETKTFMKYRGIGLFLMDCTFDGNELESTEWFLEFLEDLAFDKRVTNLPCRQMHFAVLGIGNPRRDHKQYNRIARALTRRLNSIGAVALYPLCYICSHSNAELEKQAAAWASRIAQVLDKYETRITKCSRSFWYYDSDSDDSNKSDSDKGQEFLSDHSII
uniref:Flavodoxin-like domain-containing protein n=1 Tax=Elaeophora elaphi TaxID=1147741 RepID=A0A0R3RZ77_9BILA